MKILVFAKEVQDTRVPLAYDDRTGKLRTEWNIPVLNAADASAMQAALDMKERVAGTHVTAIHLGSPSGERCIRELVALGCDEGVRVWDEDFADLTVQAKAFIFARVAKILQFDLILTGTSSQDTGNAQLGTLLASHLQVPCATHVVTFENRKPGTLAATKKLAQGWQQRIEAQLPAVLAMEGQEPLRRYAAMTALVEANDKNIPCLDLAQMGLPRQSIQQIASLLNIGPLRFPVSRLKFQAAPDSSLPAFERIEKLLAGAMTKREGKVVDGEDRVVEEIFQTLLREGWLRHLR